MPMRTLIWGFELEVVPRTAGELLPSGGGHVGHWQAGPSSEGAVAVSQFPRFGRGAAVAPWAGSIL